MRSEAPDAVFLGGDLLAHGTVGEAADAFVVDFLAPLLGVARGARCDVFLILGNDDPRTAEAAVRERERSGDWTYLHQRAVPWRGHEVFGYGCVPPTPFLLKDWERYDVSRHVDPGCVSPEEGWRTLEVDERAIRYGTIQSDLAALAASHDLSRAVFLFHAPPYDTLLDRAALDGVMVDHVPVDVHVGSIAVRRFIEARQPPLTLHGHVHESARITGAWREHSGRTVMLGAAHDGPELALVRFDPSRPQEATRELIDVAATT
jgi:Icc-related predicted phosphoesterase